MDCNLLQFCLQCFMYSPQIPTHIIVMLLDMEIYEEINERST